MINGRTKEYFKLGERNNVRESAKRLRRQFLCYKDAEIVHGIQHKKLLEMASKPDIFFAVELGAIVSTPHSGMAVPLKSLHNLYTGKHDLNTLFIPHRV